MIDGDGDDHGDGLVGICWVTMVMMVMINTVAEMEVFIQSNSKLPDLSTDRWKYPSHKVTNLSALGTYTT